MKKLFSFFSAAIFLSVSTLSSCQKDGIHPEVSTVNSTQYTPNFVLAKTSNELIALRKDPKANILRSLIDYDAVVARSPLVKLSKQDREQFRKQLVVRDSVGIVSINYLIIQKQLNKDEFAQVMSMFGLDVKYGYWGFSTDAKIMQQLSGIDVTTNSSNDELQPPADHTYYKCVSPHNCKKDIEYICLTGC